MKTKDIFKKQLKCFSVFNVVLEFCLALCRSARMLMWGM